MVFTKWEFDKARNEHYWVDNEEQCYIYESGQRISLPQDYVIQQQGAPQPAHGRELSRGSSDWSATTAFSNLSLDDGATPAHDVEKEDVQAVESAPCAQPPASESTGGFDYPPYPVQQGAVHQGHQLIPWAHSGQQNSLLQFAEFPRPMQYHPLSPYQHYGPLPVSPGSTGHSQYEAQQNTQGPWAPQIGKSVPYHQRGAILGHSTPVQSPVQSPFQSPFQSPLHPRSPEPSNEPILQEVARNVEKEPKEEVIPGVRPHRKLFGSAGYVEKLDPNFHVRYPGYEFFKVGVVFRILWPELAGDANDNTTIVTTRFQERMSCKIRWFVVVREGHNCCTCLYADPDIWKKGRDRDQGEKPARHNLHWLRSTATITCRAP
ncbi:hypothetical protein BU26DRAFT_246723 [Trematosphaeria pertusa]|uniref:DUF6590 domain-containing protein n=1 Tax=Trematosphaeria pertusa TaxID=390896 RepID=A0A6A6IQQ7_9PLEO|nr:uncharacterized protein BU26DRAFT_246723 [Trematosphaeria pertusa]KAF2251910.1 hypothetical protein BU26DRAFT_246723 [Trematosphaeria pertusa]